MRITSIQKNSLLSAQAEQSISRALSINSNSEISLSSPKNEIFKPNSKFNKT